MLFSFFFFLLSGHFKNCWWSNSMESWRMKKQVMPWKMALCVIRNQSWRAILGVLTLCKYMFRTLAHNANVEHDFSFMSVQWTKEQCKLDVTTVETIWTETVTVRNLMSKFCKINELVRKTKLSEKIIKERGMQFSYFR